MAPDTSVLVENEAFDLPDDLTRIEVSVTLALCEGLNLNWDLSAIFLGSDGKMWAEDSLVFYQKTNDSLRPAVRLGCEGSDDCIVIDLPRVDARTYTILFVVTSFGEDGQQDLGAAQGMVVSLIDSWTKEERCRSRLVENVSGQTSVGVAALRRKGSAWEFVALAECIGKSTIGLEDVLEHYSRSIGEGP
jgi:stress response protein SCP2